jgi:hypothetical protein
VGLIITGVFKVENEVENFQKMVSGFGRFSPPTPFGLAELATGCITSGPNFSSNYPRGRDGSPGDIDAGFQPVSHLRTRLFSGPGLPAGS